MNTPARKTYAAPVAVAIVLLLAWSTAGGGRPDDQDLAKRLDRLEERIRALESAVGVAEKSPDHSSLARRVSTLEEGLRHLSKVTGRPPWSSTGSNLRELERSTRDTQRQQKELEQKLGNVRRELRSAVDSLRDARDIKSKLDRLDRALDNLKDRVRQLESR